MNDITKKNEEFFGKQWGEKYNKLTQIHDQNFVNHLLQCTNSVPEDWKDKKVFEGGAGSGRNSLGALELGVKYILISELSTGGVLSIHDNLRDYENKNIYQASLTNLNKEENNQYDIVFSVNCLPHIPDYKKALSEMVRICKPGGLIMFNVNPQRPTIIAEIDNKIREHTTKMCPHCLKEFAKIMAFWGKHKKIYPALKNLMELSGDELSAYDHFGLPFTQESSVEQITKDMKELGCEILAINNHIAVKARKK